MNVDDINENQKEAVEEAIGLLFSQISFLVSELRKLQTNKPYITTISFNKNYNPTYGDDRVCECDHPYYRHFDTYDDMYPCGCKYCDCYTFEEQTEKENIDG
jgi:hypothetical protein